MVEDYLKELDEYNSKEEEKIDMHNHTQGSDGEDSPLMLLLRAYRMGLKTIRRKSFSCSLGKIFIK